MKIRSLALVLLCSCTEPQEQPATPDALTLGCFANAIQSSRQGDILLLEKEEFLPAWENQRRMGTLPPGCWASAPPKCDSECQ